MKENVILNLKFHKIVKYEFSCQERNFISFFPSFRFSFFLLSLSTFLLSLYFFFLTTYFHLYCIFLGYFSFYLPLSLPFWRIIENYVSANLGIVRTRCFRIRRAQATHAWHYEVPSSDARLALAVFQNPSVSQIHLLFLGLNSSPFHLCTRNVKTVETFCVSFAPLHELQTALRLEGGYILLQNGV